MPLSRTRRLTILAQDPSLKDKDGKILRAQVEIPAEDLPPGPRGYRVHIIDYDTSTGTLYLPINYPPPKNGKYPDPFTLDERYENDDYLLADPRFHQQNAYAIIMRTLSRFEFALGRRIGWGFEGHQIHVAPHAFPDANAFYSETNRALLFGYFIPPAVIGQPREIVHTCLSHDIVAHETSHAILDGLRTRYTMPSTPEQMGFHEGFADVVALLSVFSIKEVVEIAFEKMRDGSGIAESPGNPNLIDKSLFEIEALKKSILLGLAEQFGQASSGKSKSALRRSVDLAPMVPRSKPYLERNEFQEAHRCGEVFVAAIMNAFLKVWRKRLEKYFPKGDPIDLDRMIVVEEGAEAADTLLTMVIRGIDYTPPSDIKFADFLSALLTSDSETVPDDSRYGYREILRESFRSYGIKPAAEEKDDGTWNVCDEKFRYDRTHFDSLLSDPNEVFRFIWDNRKILELDERAYAQVESVRPCMRIGPDGFAVKETIAEYIEMVTLKASELGTFEIKKPRDMADNYELTLYGGGTLIFDEYGKLKYQVRCRVFNKERQSAKLGYLWDNGYFSGDRSFKKVSFSEMHLQRAGNTTPKYSEGF